MWIVLFSIFTQMNELLYVRHLCTVSYYCTLIGTLDAYFDTIGPQIYAGQTLYSRIRKQFTVPLGHTGYLSKRLT